ncbi:hypothetical protein EDB89DRAFT_1900429 [Lactarius sanguifluus]|nr:hypothetical protein EDB89DRAFT_1900429 [Lactarius sanguifluus]
MGKTTTSPSPSSPIIIDETGLTTRLLPTSLTPTVNRATPSPHQHDVTTTLCKTLRPPTHHDASKTHPTHDLNPRHATPPPRRPAAYETINPPQHRLSELLLPRLSHHPTASSLVTLSDQPEITLAALRGDTVLSHSAAMHSELRLSSRKTSATPVHGPSWQEGHSMTEQHPFNATATMVIQVLIQVPSSSSNDDGQPHGFELP